MTRAFLLAALLASAAAAQAPSPAEQARWAATAARVTIQRDDWGIAHVHGKSDADAVFGMVYAQAEDDFNRIETNFLTSLGRLAEAEGKTAIWQDLRQQMFLDHTQLKREYAGAPKWLQALCVGWADALNFYLAKHPQVKPRALDRFEPWMALSFSEGSIGGDIEHVDLDKLKALYDGDKIAVASAKPDLIAEPRGSNGIAIAPKVTAGGHALLLINPHTSFFFRSELQVSSDEGLNAYGAATWGQFFIYQGFNRSAGWMHTSSGVDNIDDFAEEIMPQGEGKLGYRHGAGVKPVTTREIVIAYKAEDGGLDEGRFTARFTHHGPIVARDADGKFIAVSLMNTPVKALEQSFLRTKAADYAAFAKVGALQANSSNDTLFADARGNIAYLHPQFVAKRSPGANYRAAVDGSEPANDWQGATPLNELPMLVNPPSGWAVNTNDEPWAAAGIGSLNKADFPAYMDQAGPNPRGEHARALLTGKAGWTGPKLIAAAYDSWMPEFDHLVPKLVAAWDALPAGGQKDRLAPQVAALKGWDRRWSAASTETSLAVFWGTDLWAKTPSSGPVVMDEFDSRWARMEAQPPGELLAALERATAKLTADFGRWQVPWGEINRFQRNDGAIVQTFDDAKASTPVPFTSALWGSLASFGAKAYPGTKKWYGTSGNSFVAVVEFGPKVKAWAVTAGGESGDPKSPHFNDQALRYAAGDLRPVYFHPDELAGHVSRRYRPGE